MDRSTKRILLYEKKRCDDVVKEYFEENPHVLEAMPECPVCFEKMCENYGTVRYVCCGKLICYQCSTQGGCALDVCPLCRGMSPDNQDEVVPILEQKADLGFAWAMADLGQYYLTGSNGAQKDEKKALELFAGAVQKNSTTAKEHLGDYYCHVADDDDKAR